MHMYIKQVDIGRQDPGNHALSSVSFDYDATLPYSFEMEAVMHACNSSLLNDVDHIHRKSASRRLAN
jgi:hypothetical protein